MASAFGLTLNEAAVMPLVSEIKDDFATITLKNKVRVEVGPPPVYEKREATIPFVDKESKELLLRAFQEFDDAATAERLSLTAGPVKFTKFREILGIEYRTDWDNCVALQANRTIATFNAARTEFIGLLFKDTDYINQKEYLSRARKPRSMDINELVQRLRVINSLMAYLPGSGGNPAYTDQELKVLFFQMMPSDWKLAYLKTARPITDATYTCLDMARYMRIHESAAAALQRQAAQRPRGQVRGGPNRGRNDRAGGRRQGGRDRTVGRDGGGRNVRQRGNDGNDRPCPFPGHNHQWNQCFANPHGPNYRPNYDPLGARGGNQGRGRRGGRGRREDANLLETGNELIDSPESGTTTDTPEASSPNGEDMQLNDGTYDEHWLDNLQGDLVRSWKGRVKQA